MKTLMMKFTLLLLVMMNAGMAIAQEVQGLKISNPTQTIGINIGDVLTRTITFESNSFQKLESSNLPVKGTREKGIELVGATVTADNKSSIWYYKVVLSYQVFAHAATPTVMRLPTEKIKFTAAENLTIPEWKFWFSPLVVTSVENVQANIQPQAKTPLIPVVNIYYTLMALVTLMVVSLTGLLYFNIDSQWIPFLGGPFSKSYKAIRKITKNRNIPDKSKAALLELHVAFNQIHGENLFAQDVDKFLTNNPKYQRLSAEISSFFNLSNHALFTRQSLNGSDLLNKLGDLSKRLRDCERGA